MAKITEREARAVYNEAKGIYHKLGKKALGKPKSSAVHRDYREAKRLKNIAGKQLAAITHRRPRKGRR